MPSILEALTELHWTNILELWSATSRGRISDVTAAWFLSKYLFQSLQDVILRFLGWGVCKSDFISCENELFLSSRGLVFNRWSLAPNKRNILFFFYKNIVFPAQAEYSYFSADFRLKIFLYYSWIIAYDIFVLEFMGVSRSVSRYIVQVLHRFSLLNTVHMYYMYRLLNCHYC